MDWRQFLLKNSMVFVLEGKMRLSELLVSIAFPWVKLKTIIIRKQ